MLAPDEGRELLDRLSETKLERRTDLAEQLEEPREMEKVRSQLVTFAEDAIRDRRPKGHWDDWKLGRLLEDVKWKDGYELKRDDYVLVSLNARMMCTEKGCIFFTTIYNPVSGGECVIAVHKVEIL